jgi:hypothetical protein
MNLKMESEFWNGLNVVLNHVTLCEVCKTILSQMRSKMGFWGDFGRVSWEGTQNFEFPGTWGLPGEQMLRHGERVLNNTCCIAHFDLLGCFRTSLSVPFVLFWCCFDELSVCNHVYLKLINFCWIKTNFGYMNMNFLNGIKVRFSQMKCCCDNLTTMNMNVEDGCRLGKDTYHSSKLYFTTSLSSYYPKLKPNTSTSQNPIQTWKG